MPLETGSNIADLNPLWPTGNDPKSQGDDHIRLMKAVMGNIYPVGAIYTSVVATEPSTLFGGTWVPFSQNLTLVGAGDTYAVRDTGGAETHTLTEAELAAHAHTVDPPLTGTDIQGDHAHLPDGGGSFIATGNGATQGFAFGGAYQPTNGVATDIAGAHAHNLDIPEFPSGSSGSGQAHNNMMPYVAVYMWERTA